MSPAAPLRAAVLCALVVAAPLFPDAVPKLQFHAPERLAPMVERLEKGVDRGALAATAELVGLTEAGPPIPVHLATEGTVLARRAPAWGVAYATPGGNIVLLPSRVPSYPNRSIETVLVHEVAHVMIYRAARGREVPRWFHEGLALYAARGWGIEDRSRVLWAMLRGRDSTLAALEERFQGGRLEASRAYAFSGAFLRYLIKEHGRQLPGEVLAGVAAGEPFHVAFKNVTGQTILEVEESFFRHLDFWNRWVPFLTSSTTLWIVISLLAVYAFKRRRAKDAEILERWDEEERRWLAEEPSDSWVN